MSEQASAPRSILLVSEPGMDGVFNYVRNLATYLLSIGWSVHWAYSSQRDCPALHEFVRHVEAAGGRTLDLRVGNSPGLADLIALAKLRSLARAVRPEIIHAHSSKAGVLARILPHLGIEADYFYTPHAYYEMHGPSGPKKRFFGAIERALGGVGITLNTSDSEAAYAAQVLRIAKKHLCVALTGVDCDRFRPPVSSEEQQAARAKFALPLHGPLLGTVARFSAQKDPFTLYGGLLEAMAQDKHLHFAHLGKGELQDEIDALLATAPVTIRERIFQVGTSDDTPTFYRALDAFTLPSRYEGFPLSGLEALASGLPLILTDCPGNDDFKQFGFDDIRWSIPGDATSLGTQILDWVKIDPAPNNHREVTVQRLEIHQAWAEVTRCYDIHRKWGDAQSIA